jgi:spore maturation protein CgeB
MASTPAAMTRALADLRGDPALRASLVASGLETIRARHTCAHRVDELVAIVGGLRGRSPAAVEVLS